MFVEDMAKYFDDHPEVRVYVPVNEGMILLDCVVQRFAHPQIDLEIGDDLISQADIDPEGTCIVSCDAAGYNYGINARLRSQGEGRQLKLEAIKVTNSPQRRRFFRVDTEINLKYWLIGEDGGSIRRRTSLSVNLSAVGMRFASSESLQVGQVLGLEIGFPAMRGEIVLCTGKVVAFRSSGQGLRETALDFVNLDPDAQETIIRYCLAEQRRQIRSRVRVLQPE